jgi:hypothetical protein
MAYEIPTLDLPLKAAADLSSKQYYYVKITADSTVNVCTAATDIPIGILQNKPDAAGKTADVRVLGVSKLSADAALTAGWLVGPSADGQGDRKIPGTYTTEYAVGQVIVGVSNAADLATVTVDCLNPHRAA